MIGLRATPALRKAIEAWANRQADAPRLSEAVRRLVEVALAGTSPRVAVSKKTAANTSKVAGETIDRLGDKSVPLEVQAKRKSRLLKGPSEFRDMRSDLAKPKA